MLGLSQGLQRLLLMRHGFLLASEMLILWQRFATLDSTQLGNEPAAIRQACARAIPFEHTPLFGLAGCYPDTGPPGKDT